MRILTEASGSLVASYLINAIRDAGYEAVGSDIDTLNPGFCLADDFVALPHKNDPGLWNAIEKALLNKKISVVIPSFDETMVGWAERREYFARLGVFIVVSPLETVRICQDKWETYRFFNGAGVPCPRTSLEQNYPLVKPRLGRGAEGVCIPHGPVSMEGMISQEIAQGEEYTVDAFFDREGEPVYIVPRKRIGVQNGKSTRGIVCRHDGIEHYIRVMGQAARFSGPINFQCFVEGETLSFIEINPRIAGGMALGFAATENWVRLIVDNLILGRPINPKPVRYGLKMVRYYAECFIP